MVSEEDVEKVIKSILMNSLDGLEFEELRDRLEDIGLYVDNYQLRKIIVNMIKNGLICKKVSAIKKKLLLKLCN